MFLISFSMQKKNETKYLEIIFFPDFKKQNQIDDEC